MAMFHKAKKKIREKKIAYEAREGKKELPFQYYK